MTSVVRALFAVALLVLVCACARDVRESWTSGKPKHVGQLVDGEQSGEWSYFFESGARQAIGTWKDDHQDGDWQWWYEDGTPKQQGRYAHALRVGTWSYWYPNGKLYCRGDYELDHQVGPWVYYHANGKLAAVGAFDAGVKAMAWRWWREDGSPQEQGAYWNGMKVGPWTTWGVDGTAATTDQGCPPGMECYREPADGAVRRWGAVTHDESRDLWLSFDDRGALRAVSTDGSDGERYLALAEDGQPLAFTAVRRQSADLRGSSPGHLGAPQTWTRWDRDRARFAPAAPMWSVETLTSGAGDLQDEATRLHDALHAPLAKDEPVKAPEAKPDLALPPKDRPALTPMAVLPISYWTKREEATAAALIAKMKTGHWPDASPYDVDIGPRGRQRVDLHGKPLTVTRLLSSTGDVVDLDDFKGRKNVLLVVLRGFAGQVCVYCATQTAAIAQSLDQFAALDTAVVLVYPGAAESVPVFIDAVRTLGVDKPKVPIALDVDLQLVRALQISHQLAKPTSIVIDKQGIVRYAYVGETRADRPSVDDLLRAVRSLSPAR